MKFYAVSVGRHPGIYTSWKAAKQEVDGFQGCQFKSFKSKIDAADFLYQDQPVHTKPKVPAVKGLRKDIRTAKSDDKVLKNVLRPDDIVIYADGGCRKHDDYTGEMNCLAAWAYLIGVGGADQVKTVAKSDTHLGATNNQMELTAVLEALNYLVKHHYQHRRVTLVLDSQYVLNALSKGWLLSWKRHNWHLSNGGKVKNIRLWKQIDGLIGQFNNIQGKWTKGHADNVGNVYVDSLLNQSMDQIKGYKWPTTPLPKFKLRKK